jgi:hypothetical protein
MIHVQTLKADYAPGEWILVDYPSTQLFGVSGTFKERPAKIIQVYPRFYLCQTARGQRVCQPIVGAKRAIEIGGQGHASQRLGKN